MRRLIALACVFFASGCMEMDGFLANEDEIATYQLPGNTIPMELIEAVELDSEGNTLHGFWIAAPEQPAVTILYFQGNKHNLDEYWDRIMYLHEIGVNLFIADYRGFGRSEGTFSEEGMQADARTALAHVAQRPEVDPARLGLYGFSLGNVNSIYLAAEVFRDPMFLIAEAPFAAANALIQGAVNLPMPAGWLTQGRFDNADRIRRIEAPLLLLHGEDDDFVRYRDNGRVVFQNAPEPKTLVLVPSAGHSDIPETMGVEAYQTLIADWIADLSADG